MALGGSFDLSSYRLRYLNIFLSCPSSHAQEAMRADESRETRKAEFALTLRETTVVFQCPASFRSTRENVGNMREFFGGIDCEGLQFA